MFDFDSFSVLSFLLHILAISERVRSARDMPLPVPSDCCYADLLQFVSQLKIVIILVCVSVLFGFAHGTECPAHIFHDNH